MCSHRITVEIFTAVPPVLLNVVVGDFDATRAGKTPVFVSSTSQVIKLSDLLQQEFLEKCSVRIIVNGEAVVLVAGNTVSALLDQLKLASQYVAVECNLELIPRAEHAGHLLRDGDSLEVVTLVGGG